MKKIVTISYHIGYSLEQVDKLFKEKIKEGYSYAYRVLENEHWIVTFQKEEETKTNS